MVYNFDMDGTILDLYGVDGWLNDLRNEDTRPYEIAKPLLNFSLLARYINKAQKLGHSFNIISWNAKNATEEYAQRVMLAKREYLERHMPSVHWNNVFVVAYGTPKNTLANGILFDDEENNRTVWGENAYPPSEILRILKEICA